MRLLACCRGLHLTGLLAVGLSWQAFAQVAPSLPPTQIAPIRAKPAKSIGVGGSAAAESPAAGGIFEISVELAKSVKPTLPKPTATLSELRLPEDEPSSIWYLKTQDQTLYHSMSRWAQIANWQLMWEAERDFPIQAQISIEGSFKAAIQVVMNSLAGSDFPLQAVMNDSTRVISIIRHQDPFIR
jgi:hypothetical protein